MILERPSAAHPEDRQSENLFFATENKFLIILSAPIRLFARGVKVNVSRGYIDIYYSPTTSRAPKSPSPLDTSLKRADARRIVTSERLWPSRRRRSNLRDGTRRDFSKIPAARPGERRNVALNVCGVPVRLTHARTHTFSLFLFLSLSSSLVTARRA